MRKVARRKKETRLTWPKTGKQKDYIKLKDIRKGFQKIPTNKNLIENLGKDLLIVNIVCPL